MTFLLRLIFFCQDFKSISFASYFCHSVSCGLKSEICEVHLSLILLQQLLILWKHGAPGLTLIFSDCTRVRHFEDKHAVNSGGFFHTVRLFVASLAKQSNASGTNWNIKYMVGSQMMTKLRNLCIFLMIHWTLYSDDCSPCIVNILEPGWNFFNCNMNFCACRQLASTKRQPAQLASQLTPVAVTSPQSLSRPMCSVWRSTAPNSSCSPGRHLLLRRETAL